MPRVIFDLILEVKPPQGDEIQFEDIRKLFIKLKEQGMNLKWITYDSYQSTDSVQLLRQKGFQTGTVSVDKTSLPYDVMKTAFYDGRVEAPLHDKALEEIVRLERDTEDRPHRPRAALQQGLRRRSCRRGPWADLSQGDLGSPWRAHARCHRKCRPMEEKARPALSVAPAA